MIEAFVTPTSKAGPLDVEYHCKRKLYQIHNFDHCSYIEIWTKKRKVEDKTSNPYIMAPPKPAELPIDRSIRRRQERAALLEAQEAARRAREVPTRAMQDAAALKKQFDVVYNEHEELRRECTRRLNAHDGPHYNPFDARFQPSRNQRDAYVETSGFRNKIYPEKRFLEKMQQEALANASKIWDLTDQKKAGQDVDDQLHECEEIDAQIRQKLISSNLTFYIALWDTARSECDCVTALMKKFYWYEKRYKPFQDQTSIFLSPTATRQNQHEPESTREGDRGTDISGKVWGPWRIWGLDAMSAEEQRTQKRSGDKNDFVKRETTVDIVCNNNAEWVKISNINNNRITRIMAEMGIGLEELEEESDEDEMDVSEGGEDAPLTDTSNSRTRYNARPVITPTLRKIQRGWIPRFLRDVEHDDELVDLLKFAVQYSKAAPVNRVRYLPPRIRFVCPKIEEGKNALVDRVLYDIRDLGIEVCTVDNISLRNAPDSAPRPFCTALSKMMPNPYTLLPKELNIDCTVLIALVSDISHMKDPPRLDEYAHAIKNQIDIEKEHSLLLTQLFPLIRGRKLYCTYDAAMRFCAIAATLATYTERKRAALLIERWAGEQGMEEAQEFGYEQLTPEERIAELESLSEYDLPDDIQLPVEIIDDTEDIIRRALATPTPTQPLSKEHPYLPQIASTINLLDINHSVFLYSWATGLMTVTSNRAVAKEIQSALDRYMDSTGESVTGPMLWMTNVARSFITKGAQTPVDELNNASEEN